MRLHRDVPELDWIFRVDWYVPCATAHAASAGSQAGCHLVLVCILGGNIGSFGVIYTLGNLVSLGSTGCPLLLATFQHPLPQLTRLAFLPAQFPDRTEEAV